MQKVPVLVIARDALELNAIYRKLDEALVRDDKIMAEKDLQRLCQFNEDGKLLKDQWGKVM